MQIRIITVLLLLLSTTAKAQEAFRRNTVYGEFLGNGLFASLNYERQFQNKPGLGFRAGIGYWSGDEVFRVSIPAGLLYLFTIKENKSFVDAGLGATWSTDGGIKPRSYYGSADDSKHIVSFVPSVGYRRHTKGNFMWRISFTPVINKYKLLPYPGFSFGRRF